MFCHLTYKTEIMEEVEDVYECWHKAMLKLKGQCDTDETGRHFHESQRLVEDVVQYSQPQANHKICNFQPLQPGRLKAVDFCYCSPYMHIKCDLIVTLS
jgi:hypothetical protein